VAIWVAQDFGELLTGQATDPNSGPLLIVLAAAFWPVAGWPGTSESTVAGGLRSQRTKYGRACPPVLSNRIAHDTN
jgi:hypothetical protein